MDYNKQVDIIEEYLRDREKTVENFKIGVEFEHFIVDGESLRTINFYEENGVEDSLKELVKNGWSGQYEGDYLLGASKGNKVVTLEPGSQFEFSVRAQNDLCIIEREYQEFIEEVKEILDRKNQKLIAVGYHPVTKIDEIKLLPKKRYDYMYNYFKDKGKYAHNMMKGTAALQVSLDYKDEEDYRKKVRIANAISPIMYGLSDNSFYFEGEVFPKYSLRTLIWNNMDDARSGVVKSALEDDFSYRKYAEYILEVPPIFKMENGEAVYTGEKKIKEVFDPNNYKLEELEHLMTMVFPDVRTKGFIEIRMMDSMPYPYNFGIIALLKGLFYKEENVDSLYEMFKEVSYEDIKAAKESIIEKGIFGKYRGREIIEYGRDLLEIGKKGLNKHDSRYLKELEELLNQNKNLYSLIEEKSSQGLKQSLSHCILEEFEVI